MASFSSLDETRNSTTTPPCLAYGSVGVAARQVTFPSPSLPQGQGPQSQFYNNVNNISQQGGDDLRSFGEVFVAGFAFCKESRHVDRALEKLCDVNFQLSHRWTGQHSLATTTTFVSSGGTNTYSTRLGWIYSNGESPLS